MKRSFSGRKIIRLWSFAIAAVMVLGASSAWHYKQAQDYRTQLENTYLRSLQELSSYMTSIVNTLNKGVYAGTPLQVATLSAKLWRDSGAAKVALCSLPASEVNLDNTYRFLSQVGDYAMTLSQKVSSGDNLSEEDYAHLDSLLEYAYQLNTVLSNTQDAVQKGELSLMPAQIPATLTMGYEQSASGGALLEEASKIDDYGQLIYDGPFSDHILQIEPRLTKGAAEITEEQARQKAAEASGLQPGQLTLTGIEESTMPCFCFEGGTASVAVTKYGGLLSYLVDSRAVGERKLTPDDAVKIGLDYLAKLGVGSLGATYYEVSSNICTVNFAHMQGDVVCYTDLIKVGVALDGGAVVFYDGRGYIVNHQERSLPSPALSSVQASQSLASGLTVESVQLSLIPSTGMEESFCYEFKARGRKGEQLLVYVNAMTGAEEQLLILIDTGDGTLTV
jgi:germination protein YpeB